MSRKRFLCLECGVDTGKINEYYMLEDSVWYQVHASTRGMYCIGCFEIKLGRQLSPVDFNNSYLNRARTNAKSARLSQRMGLI